MGNCDIISKEYVLLPWFCYVDFAIMKDTISHNGVIEKIENGIVYVKITQQSACAGCHAKSMCTAADNKDKIIEVSDSSGSFLRDEPVVVCGQTSLGLQAVFLAFVLPLLIVVAVIITGNTLKWEDSISALAGLAILVPFYGVLYLFRDQLKKKFIFTIEKQKTN